MASCPYQDQLSAFSDGELPEARIAEIQEHLRQCASCATELDGLQAMARLMNSERVNSFENARLSQIGLHRLQQRVGQAINEVGEEGVLRFVRVFNGIAACLLVAGSAWLMVKASGDRVTVESATPAAPPWVDVAVVSDTPSGAYSTPAAAWYLADESGRADEAP
jgi:anti-sigma factor RsiW